MHTFRMFNNTSARSAGSAVRSIAGFALLAAVCGASSPAWCKATASLWVADTVNDSVVELKPSDLESSGSPSPVVLNSAAVADASGVAFDKSKNLWVTTFDNLVLEFTPAQLKKLDTVSNPTPHATIASSSFEQIVGCTFDKHGNLWIIDGVGDSVHELTHKQLDAGSNPDITPRTNITAEALEYPNFGVFDKSGNLWVSAEDNDVIAEFTAAQLGSSGGKTPKVVLSNGSLDAPGQLGFDSKDNLWVTNIDAETVVEFDKSQLRVSGSPTAEVTLSGSAIDRPWGLALDSAGNLWFSNYGDGSIFKFSSTQLKASGTPTPPVVLTGVLELSYQMTFGPVF
jgi:sugar lactone lactonase YvrE